MSRLQHFLRSAFFPYMGIALILASFPAVELGAWLRGEPIGPLSTSNAPAVAVTHGGPTNTPTNTIFKFIYFSCGVKTMRSRVLSRASILVIFLILTSSQWQQTTYKITNTFHFFF